jgi:hypothetical protein
VPSADAWAWGEAGLRDLLTQAVVGLVEIGAALAVVLLGLALVARIAR